MPTERQVTAREFYAEALIDVRVLVPAGSFNAEWNKASVRARLKLPEFFGGKVTQYIKGTVSDDDAGDIDSAGESEDEFDEGAVEEAMPDLIDAEDSDSEDECVLQSNTAEYKFKWSKEHEDVTSDQRMKDGVGTDTWNPKLRWDQSDLDDNVMGTGYLKYFLLFLPVLLLPMWAALIQRNGAAKHGEGFITGKRKMSVGLLLVGRKPDSIGHELKTLACGACKILFRFELQEGKGPDNLKKYVSDYGATTALVLRMLEGLKGVGYILIADSWFGSTKTCILLLAWGIYSVLNVKTAYRLFPKKQLMETLKSKEKGEHVCFQADVKVSSNRTKTIFAVGHKGPGKMSKKHQKSTGWGADAVGVPLLLVSSVGTTLPGTDRVYRSHIPDEESLPKPVQRSRVADGIIEKAPKYCENTCNVVVAMKKALDGSWTDKRVALDLRGVNELSLRDRTPPRLPEDLFHDIGRDQYMTKLDLRSGFHQIVLTDDASLKTCFWWARDGAAPEQYVYKRMPFGSANSTAMFGRVIEHELRGLSCAKVYCDDILVTSPTARQHLADLEAVMQRLSKVGLRGHPGKSVFAAGGCEFLGFLLRPGKLSPHQAKVAALLEVPTPTDVRGVRAILGFMNFYRIMAARIGKEDYSSMAWPLNCLLRKGNENVKDLWGKEHDDALAQLKKRLTEPGVVIHAYDPSRPLYLMTDWSGVGISAILGQKDDEDRDVIIAAASRSLSRSEMRYSSFYGEALAAVYGVRSFRH
ncbi:hypothetical protein CYMTET_8699 [Cymbomonas tetramitiformis]|uniref:Reverse transcriptase domain-containing protein n=1 Tax=Cymbomonas tetramitiformis TaxID=36881 RepID=A0AAE0GUD9_9CHLO|nr:hypothetical protein CYMTET_8699 [Cymbomonas tetramitiformis]